MRLPEPPDVDQRATDALAPAMPDAPAPSIMAIVDDDASVGRALQRVVEAGGYTARTFASHRPPSFSTRCRDFAWPASFSTSTWAK